jgi:Ser/Thr protein kinase RdoA (MazF antagonist)
MDLTSQKIFDENGNAVLREASVRYGFDPTTLKKLGSFESFVYEFHKGGKGFILKITHSLHRTPGLVKGELEWVAYLADRGVPAAPVAPSLSGELLEVIDGQAIEGLGDDYFIVYVFEKAEGRLIRSTDWNDGLFENWGRALGRIHALTKSYSPSSKSLRRFEWHEDDSLRIQRHLPPEQCKVIEKALALISRLREWPTDADAYGLIHSDFHHGNFFLDADRITVFDFDDCHYGWFGFDIMIPLFYIMRDASINPDDTAFAPRFFGRFMSGYSEENRIDGTWVRRIPDFMKLREIDLYSVVYAEKAFDLNDWCRRFMKDRQHRIENDVPVVDIDFSQFA